MSSHAPDEVPMTIVIFGATGDLTRRKLLPALYDNFGKGRLDSVRGIVGYARREWRNEDFAARARDGIEQFASTTVEEDTWSRFRELLSYQQGNLDDAEDFRRLEKALSTAEPAGCGRLYYLATAPRFYAPACHNLAAAGMTQEEVERSPDDRFAPRRVVIEKPFGNDAASAAALDDEVHRAFQEHQVYRIDHYLGKETAQNILFMRFANTIFEPVWNRRYISNVQITVAEDVDVGHRAGYYDQAGVLRDMFQNHLLQLLSLTAMEPPTSLDPDDIRNEKVKVLRAVLPPDPTEGVRAQYDGYHDSDGVAPGSTTPTYAALRLYVNTWRWQGVPFYLRSGKALKHKTSQITVSFQEPPGILFDLPSCEGYTPNTISICIQPDEGAHLKYQVKVPDQGNASRTVDMSFHYRDGFPEAPLPDAYERLLVDAVNGDASLFARSDGIQAAWGIVDPIIKAWDEAGSDRDNGAPPMGRYPHGSWGPTEADELLAQHGHGWHVGCIHDQEGK